MGVPLLKSWGEESVSKESSVFYVVGASMTVFPHEGWTAFTKRKQGDWDFDSTKGYTGEDGKT